jgi:L-alanine-DL-glutamate epimerase-like enolase superfamily enzyme
MKIVSIDAWNEDLGMVRPYTIAFKTVDEVRNVFVKITLANGVTGIGAGNPSADVVGESIEDSIRTLDGESFEYLAKQDIREMYRLTKETQSRFPNNPAVRAAIDIALYDAFTKLLEVPLVKYLGQRIESLPTSCTIGIKNVEETLNEAMEYVERGFTVLKVKLGMNPDEDVERVLKLRERFSHIVIRVDANQGYSFDEAIDFYNRTKVAKVELIEQPLNAGAVQEMRRFPESLRELVAADESLITPSDAMKLAFPFPAAGIYNVKLMKSGGITPAIDIAMIAQYNQIKLFWGCNDESIISISAALHLAYACTNTMYIDLDGSFDLARDVVTHGFLLKDGRLYCTERPGLGVEMV